MSSRLIATFTFGGPDGWAADNRQSAEIRAQSGSSSIRISKATSAALSAFIEKVKAASPEWDAGATSRYWFRRKVTPDELLYAIATGEVVFPAPEPEPTPAPVKKKRVRSAHAKSPAGKKHAPRRSAKRMQSRRPTKTHAKGGSRRTAVKRPAKKASRGKR